MTSNTIFISILQRNGLQGPDYNRYLYEYRITAEEFADMQQTLIIELSQYLLAQTEFNVRCFPAIFVLYASEFFRRAQEPTVVSLFESLEQPHLNSQSPHWRRLVLSGMMIWSGCDDNDNTALEKPNGQKLYAETCIAQGGLPLARHKTREEFELILNRAIEFNVNQYSSEEEWYHLVKEVWSEHPSFPRRRRTHTYFTIASRFLKALSQVLYELRRNIAFNGDIANEINTLVPNWKAQLPVLIPEDHQQQILANLFAMSERLRVQQDHVDFLNVQVYLKRHGTNEENQPYILVRNFTFNTRTELTFWERVLADHGNENLPRSIPIFAQVGDKRVRLGTYNKRGSKYLWRSKTNTIEYFTGEIELWYQFNKQLFPLSHDQDDQLQSLAESPSFFDSQSLMYLGQGSIKTKYTELIVVLCTELYETPEDHCSRVGSLLKTTSPYSVWSITTSTVLNDTTGDSYSIQLGHEENTTYKPLVIGERLTIGNRMFNIFRTLHRIRISAEQSFLLTECEFRYIGAQEWQQLPPQIPMGRLEIRKVVNGIILFKTKVQLLPSDISFGSDIVNRRITIDGQNIRNVRFTLGHLPIEAVENNGVFTIDCQQCAQELLETYAFGQLEISFPESSISFKYPVPIRINRLVDRAGKTVTSQLIHIRHLSHLEAIYSNGRSKISVNTLNEYPNRSLSVEGVVSQNNTTCSMPLHETQTMASMIWADNPNPSNSINLNVDIEADPPTPSRNIQVCRFEGQLRYNAENHLVIPQAFEDLKQELFYELATDYETFVVKAWPLTLTHREPEVLTWDQESLGWRLPDKVHAVENAEKFAGTWLITASNSTGWNILRSTVVTLHPEKIEHFQRYRYTQLESFIETPMSSNERKSQIFNHIKDLVNLVHNELELEGDKVHSHKSREFKLIIDSINRFAGNVPAINVDLLQVLAHFPSIAAIAMLCCEYNKMGLVDEMLTELPFDWHLVTLEDWKAALFFADRFCHAQGMSHELEKRFLGMVNEHLVLQILVGTSPEFFQKTPHLFQSQDLIYQFMQMMGQDQCNPNAYVSDFTEQYIIGVSNDFRNNVQGRVINQLVETPTWNQFSVSGPIADILDNEDDRKACRAWLCLGQRALSCERNTQRDNNLEGLDNPRLTTQAIFELQAIQRMSPYATEQLFNLQFIGQHPETNNPFTLLEQP